MDWLQCWIWFKIASHHAIGEFIIMKSLKKILDCVKDVWKDLMDMELITGKRYFTNMKIRYSQLYKRHALIKIYQSKENIVHVSIIKNYTARKKEDEIPIYVEIYENGIIVDVSIGTRRRIDSAQGFTQEMDFIMQSSYRGERMYRNDEKTKLLETMMSLIKSEIAPDIEKMVIMMEMI